MTKIVDSSIPRGPYAYLLFPTIKKVPIELNEIIGVRLYEGKTIIGIVDEICKDKEHFWIRSSEDPSSARERCSFKLDQVIKLQ